MTIHALGTVAQIEALADQMSALADDIHKRVMKDIRAHQGGPINASERALARAGLVAVLATARRAGWARMPKPSSLPRTR